MLEAIEQLPPVEALRASFVAYPLVNALHILALGALVTSVVLLDLRILGAFGSMPEQPFVALMRRMALASFAVAGLSGLALFSIRAGDYAANPAFLVKLALLAVAGANFVVLARRGHGEHGSPALRIGATLSLVLWPAILVAGRFIGFVE